MTSSNTNKVAVIGRPNVGKSSIFNRLVGYKAALVHDTPGVTRDRKYAQVLMGEQAVELIDTAGFEEGGKQELTRRMNEISKKAMDEAAAVLFVVDGNAGLTPADEGLARLVKQANKPVIFVINKADTKATIANVNEFYQLGFDEPILVSAAHNSGFPDILDALLPFAQVISDISIEEEIDTSGIDGMDPETIEEEIVVEEEKPYRPDWLRITIVGRPNAGKSTLVNQLLGEERMMTGDQAGLTRESTITRWETEGVGYELIDTAGLRKKARIDDDSIEKMSASDAIRAVGQAHVVILLLDATCPFEHQDKTIAAHVVGEGKPLIIALNKWDLVKDKKELLDEMGFMLEKSFSQVRGVPLIPISALSGKGVQDLLKPVEHLYRLWNIRIGTSKLNAFLRDALEAHTPPMTSDHRPVKMKYMVQSSVRPPTFKIWCNRPQAVQVSYLRYLTNGMRKVFKLDGIVFRLVTMSGENPYHKP